MKKLFTVSLSIFALLIFSAHAMARSCGPGCETNEPLPSEPTWVTLGPGDLDHEAGGACANELVISDDPQACTAAINTCKIHFKSCVHDRCGSYQDYYNDTYYNCKESTLNQCETERHDEKVGAVATACAFGVDKDKTSNEWPQAEGETTDNNPSDWPQMNGQTVTVQYIPGVIAHYNGPDSVNPQDPGTDVETDQPSEPTTDSEVDLPSDSNAGFSNEAAADPMVEFSGSGGCSLQALGSPAASLQYGLYLILGFLPGVWVTRRRK